MEGNGGGKVDRLAAAREEAREMAAEVQELASGLASSVRLRAAERLEGAAQRLVRLAAEAADTDGATPPVAEGAQRVASGLESTAEFLREGDAAAARSALEAEIRENPLRSVAAAAVVGFAVGRILR